MPDRQEQHTDLDETLMAVDTLDRMPDVHWQPTRDRDPRAWRDQEVQVMAYASDRVRHLYMAWDGALLRLAGVVQPGPVTGAPRLRPDDVVSAVRTAIGEVVGTGDRLLEQIRFELGAEAVPRFRRWLRFKVFRCRLPA
jgi:hypothetical protein